MEQQKPGSPEESWKQLKSNITKAAKRIVGFKKELAKKPWITDDMIQKMEERQKWKHQTTEEAKQQYRKLNNELRRETDRAREMRWQNQSAELEELQRQGRQDQVSRPSLNRIRELTSKRNRRGLTVIQDKNGNLLTEPEKIANRWKEYIEELYNKDNKPQDIWIEEQNEAFCNEGPDLLKDEILQALKEMKCNKAERPYNLPAEMLKCLDEKATTAMTDLCKDIYARVSGRQIFFST